jgi:hypothetical protein
MAWNREAAVLWYLPFYRHFFKMKCYRFLKSTQKDSFFNMRSLCTFEAVQRDGSKSTPRGANPYKSADPILHCEPPLLKNRSNASGNFKHLKSVGVPLFVPNLSFKVIIKKLFSWECPFKLYSRGQISNNLVFSNVG